MSKELFEELLGKDAGDVLQDALERNAELMSPVESEAVRVYREDPEGLSEPHKQGLNDLLSAISDDFTVRRRAAMLRTLMTPPIPETDDWIPEDEEGEQGTKEAFPQLKKGGNEEDLADFLENLDED